MALRRVLVSFCLGAALVVPALLTATDGATQAARCPTGDDLAFVLPGACSHVDEAPPGVDVTEPVSTTELRTRTGGTAEAWRAAQELGVAAPVAAAATSPAVSCDGDGTSGYRTQGMYVVEAGKTNRFAALQGSFQLWAAGVDDVVNRSAALTGGVRHVRYVTDPSGGTCVARILNVTVPAGSMSSFNATVSAVQALGYTDPARKYLMWTDATVLCGIASMYPYDTDGQGNPNNGSYAQYARVDAGCWGGGDGAGQHSVEAHELLHTFGGVQNTAPHATKAGHCWDESDTMCYADGGTHAMVQVCPAEREYLYDCTNDDYFSTFPDPGSYLDTHWNAADSRFLIGGGDGSGGGSLGTPTVLGGVIGVNNPAIPGLATQASVSPSVPTGRTITSVAWKSARTDCVFSAPTALQTDVTCAATATGSTTVTVTVKDSTGASKVLTSPLTFATGTARPVSVSLAAAGQSGSTASVCTGTAFPLVARVVDTASGQPVKGLATTITKQTAAMTAPAAAGSPMTSVEGSATLAQTVTVATTYVARTTAGTVFAAAVPTTVATTPVKCATALTAAIDKSATWYADPVVVTGTLAPTAAGAPVTTTGLTLTAKLVLANGTSASLGTTKTAADGSYALTVKPTATGAVVVSLAGTTGLTAATAAAGTVTVTVPQTRITGAVDRTDVGWGQPVTVTGALERVMDATTAPLGGKQVAVNVTPTGKAAARVATATVAADGTFRVVVPLKTTGVLSVVFAGTAGQPAATATVSPVVAGTWATTVTATSSASSVLLGQAITLSGSVTRSYGTTSGPAPSVRVSLYFQATGATTATLVTSASTTATGTWSARVSPRSTGTWTVRVLAQPGYDASSAAPIAVAVS